MRPSAGLHTVADLITDCLSLEDCLRMAMASHGMCDVLRARMNGNITVGDVRLLPAALWAAGPALRMLTIRASTTRLVASTLSRLDALPRGSVVVNVIATECDPATAEAVTEKLAVKGLCMDAYVCGPGDIEVLSRCTGRMKLALTGALELQADDVMDKHVFDVVRHVHLRELRIRATVVPTAIMACTFASHVVFCHASWTDAMATALVSNSHVKELTMVARASADMFRIAALLSSGADYSEGITLRADVRDKYFEGNDEVGRVMADAFATLRVGRHLRIDATFAVSPRYGIPDDAMIGAIAACVSRNVTVKDVFLRIGGCPDPGVGVNAMLRLPKHVESVRIDIYDTDRFEWGNIESDDVGNSNDNDWLWAALAGMRLPGVRLLEVLCHTNGAGGDVAAHVAAGRAFAKRAPRLQHFVVGFDDRFMGARSQLEFMNAVIAFGKPLFHAKPRNTVKLWMYPGMLHASGLQWTRS